MSNKAARRARSRSTGRDSLTIASPRPYRLHGGRSFVSTSNDYSLPNLRGVSDLRYWNPAGSFPVARTFKARPARFVVAAVKPKARSGRSVSPYSGLTHRVAFKAPRSVLVCVRRARRREVLHALGVAGGKVRPGRRGPFSDVSCGG